MPDLLSLRLTRLEERLLRRLAIRYCARHGHRAYQGCTRADPDNPARSISESWCSFCGWHSRPETVEEHARRVLGAPCAD